GAAPIRAGRRGTARALPRIEGRNEIRRREVESPRRSGRSRVQCHWSCGRGCRRGSRSARRRRCAAHRTRRRRRRNAARSRTPRWCSRAPAPARRDVRPRTLGLPTRAGTDYAWSLEFATLHPREVEAMRNQALAVIVAIVLGACAPSATPAATQQASSAATGAPEPSVSITFWHGQSGVLGDRLNDLITKFNASHKVQVQGTFQGTYDQLYQKIVSAIQAGSVPDMA